MKRIAIIGAGISGLTLAYKLKKMELKDIEIKVFEKNNRAGGTILTEKYSGFTIEAGPDCFITEKPWAMELAREIGLGSRLIGTIPEKRKTYVLSDGALHPIPEGLILMIPTKILPLITSTLFTPSGKIRMGLEIFIPRRRSTTDESLAEFIIRRFGREALEKIAEPLVAGVHAGEPETMSVKSSFPKFVEMEKRYRSLILGMLRMRGKFKKKYGGSEEEKSMFMTFVNGLGEMIEKLEELIGRETIIFNREITDIQRSADGFIIKSPGNETERFDALVLAVPSYISANLLKNTSPELSNLLKNIPFVSTATVTLVYKTDNFHHPLDGYGFVIPSKEKRKIMAVTWTSSKFRFRVPHGFVMLRCFIGGARNSHLVDLEDDELIKIVREELKTIMGIMSEPYLTKIYKWPRAMPQYVIGHEENLRRIEEKLKRIPGLFIAGSSYRGIGISDCIKNATEVAEKVKEIISSG